MLDDQLPLAQAGFLSRCRELQTGLLPQRVLTMSPTPVLLTLTFAISASLCLSASPSLANCSCSAPWQEHTPYPYRFSTSSCAYPAAPAGAYIYETCITNHSDDRYLYFDWLIPGPKSWVPPGVTLPSKRPRPEASLLRQNGCLSYGNFEQLSYAEFLPHRGDTPRLTDAAHRDCASPSLWQDPNVQTDDRRDIFVIRENSIWVFAPTDRARVAETMLRLNAEVDVEPEGDYFWHTITLRAEPYGAVFQPDHIHVVPELQELRTAYADQATDGRLPVSREGQRFILHHPMPPVTPRLEDVRFDVITDDGDTVATLLVPFWR